MSKYTTADKENLNMRSNSNSDRSFKAKAITNEKVAVNLSKKGFSPN